MLVQKEQKKERLTQGIKKCDRCGKLYVGQEDWVKFYPKTRDREAYICPDCIKVKSYYDKNDFIRYTTSKEEKSRWTFSFELESYPLTQQAHALLCSSDYQFLPTRDGSLMPNGVEYKTPVYSCLNGVKPIFRAFEECADPSPSECGQHINIGHTSYINEYSYMDILNDAEPFFSPLYYHMKENKEKTMVVCGRMFNEYCMMANDYNSHYNWISIRNYYKIEFRLSKFVDSNQYFWLVNMWKDMLDVYFKDIFPKRYETGHQERLVKGSKKLIKIFDKYADGKANCQRPERNSR